MASATLLRGLRFLVWCPEYIRAAFAGQHLRLAQALYTHFSSGWGLSWLVTHPPAPPIPAAGLHTAGSFHLASCDSKTGGREGGVLLPSPDLTLQAPQRHLEQTGLSRPDQETQNKGGLLLSAASFCQKINCESNNLKNKNEKLEQQRNALGTTWMKLRHPFSFH